MRRFGIPMDNEPMRTPGRHGFFPNPDRGFGRPGWARSVGIRRVRAFFFATFMVCLASCGERSSDTPFEPGGDLPQGARIRILFGGDTAFAESYGESHRRRLAEKGYDFSLAALQPLLRTADLVVCNLETPVTHLRKSPHDGRKAYVHWTDAARAPEAYRENGMHAFSLANNHTLDYGVAGLRHTLDILERNGIARFGAGMNEEEAARPFVREFSVGTCRLRLAVIGAFQYSPEYDFRYEFYADGEKGGCRRLCEKQIRKQIRRLKARDCPTYIIVYPHWGYNYAWKTRGQALMGRALIEAGADLVIGHGGHGMQEIERYRDKWILYGLGNFVFLTDGRYRQKKFPPYSLAAMLHIFDDRGKPDVRIRLYPILSDNLETGFQPRPLAPVEFDRFCSLLAKKSGLSGRDAAGITRGGDHAGSYLQFKVW